MGGYQQQIGVGLGRAKSDFIQENQATVPSGNPNLEQDIRCPMGKIIWIHKCQISHGQVALAKGFHTSLQPSKDQVDLTLGKRSSLVKGFGSKGGPGGLEIGDEITHVNDLRFMSWHPGLE